MRPRAPWDVKNKGEINTFFKHYLLSTQKFLQEFSMGKGLCKELWGLRSWPSSSAQPGQDWGQTSQTRPWPLFPCRLLQTSSWESPSDRSRQQRSWRAPCIFVQSIFDGYSLGSGGRNRRLAPVRERLQYFGHVRLGDQHISKYIPYAFDYVPLQCFTFPRSSSVGSFPLMMVGELGANLVYL